MHQILYTYYYFLKPSLAPSKVMDVFIKAAEYTEIPVHRTDKEPLQKIFMLVRSDRSQEHQASAGKILEAASSPCKVLRADDQVEEWQKSGKGTCSVVRRAHVHVLIWMIVISLIC